MRGIDKFKERFAGHDGEYVLIGGGAYDLLFGEAGRTSGPPRTSTWSFWWRR